MMFKHHAEANEHSRQPNEEKQIHIFDVLMFVVWGVGNGEPLNLFEIRTCVTFMNRKIANNQQIVWIWWSKEMKWMRMVKTSSSFSWTDSKAYNYFHREHLLFAHRSGSVCKEKTDWSQKFFIQSWNQKLTVRFFFRRKKPCSDIKHRAKRC